MDRGPWSKAGSAPAGDFEAASKGRLRRPVLDDARRKVERALATVDAAQELARAAEAVVNSAETDLLGQESTGLSALRVALARYRAAHGD